MADKVLFQTSLTKLSITDKDGIGELRHESDGKVYRYIKNVSATALVRKGSCLKALTSVLGGMNKGVRSPDFATLTGATASMLIAAGVPVTGIGATGSTYTGAFGFVQVAGPARVNMLMSAVTAGVSGLPGRVSIATGLIATAGWDVPEALDANCVNGVLLVGKLRPGTAAAARSANVEVVCL